MIRAIKLQLYLNDEQRVYASKLFGTSRFIYNNLLSYKIQKYNLDKSTVSFGELGKQLVNLKSEYEWIKDSHSKVLQQSIIDLDKAYKSFFKNGYGFPKFKSKKDNKNSCRFPVDAISGINGNRITLIKQLKDIHFKCSINDERFLNKNQDEIKSATLTKSKSGKYFLSILIDKPTKTLAKATNDIIGIDLGIKDFIVDSNGKRYENIKIKRNNEKQLARLHKQMSRKLMIGTGEFKFNEKWQKDVEIKRPSKNREKARIKLAKLYEKLTNKKENYLHHVVNELLNENQVIVIEDLNIEGMMKNHNLAKSIQELSLSRFKTILKYKALWYGRDVIEIDRFFPSSKLCSNCGSKNTELKLSDREWECTTCNTIHDRDLNAAVNIREEGSRILKIGLSSPE
jgi:putative transposase